MRENSPSPSSEPSTSIATDHSLLRRFQRGEGDAATQLYVRYAERLARLARHGMSPQLAARLDPEDVVQSVFRTFFRRSAAGLFEVPASDQLWQLLLVIATNKVRQLGRFHRQHKRDVAKTLLDDRPLGDLASQDSMPLTVLEMVIEEAMADLPDFQQRMIELRIQGYTAEEIAAATQRCSRTVERVLRRFRDKMSQVIEGSGHGDNALEK